MDIILVSNRFAKARSITLHGRHLLLAALLAVGAPFATVFAVQHVMVHAQPEMVGAQTEGQQKQQSYLRDGIDALAVRVGQMQAQLLRLDTLGARLAKMSGMQPQEFNFDQAPPQGGPFVPAAQQDVSMSSLDQQLASLATLLNDRNDKLVAMETLLMQDSLDKKEFPSVAPVSGGNYSSNFGWRIDPFTGQNAMHEGVDFMAPEGTPIVASAAGIVVYSGLHPQYGNMVEIDHGNDIVTRYGHASKLLVKVGQVVQRGQEIAEVGSTGRSTGNHLHFEVRYKGIAQNPRRFLESASS
jgi:murein DD-endopeptidase MepM/ murein hydrolase activator NlpD